MPQKMTEHIITQALRINASDVHIHPLSNRYLLRLRVNGTLIPLLYLPIDVGEKLISFLKFQAALDISEKSDLNPVVLKKIQTQKKLLYDFLLCPAKISMKAWLFEFFVTSTLSHF